MADNRAVTAGRGKSASSQPSTPRSHAVDHAVKDHCIFLERRAVLFHASALSLLVSRVHQPPAFQRRPGPCVLCPVSSSSY